MANENRAAGFLPVAHATGGTPQRLSDYRIAGGYDADIFYGDPVKSTGTGNNIAKATPGDLIVGVFAGCQYIDASGAVIFQPYWAANTVVQDGSQVTAQVYDDPGTVFEIQASGDLEAADIRAGADILPGDGKRATGNSSVQLDSDSIGAGAGKQLKILSLVNRADNDYGERAKVRVLISKHELGGAATPV